MKKKYIISNPDIMTGKPVIAGTRIPIAVVISLLKQGNTVAEIHDMYNWVDKKKLEGAIDEVIEVISDSLNAKKVL